MSLESHLNVLEGILAFFLKFSITNLEKIAERFLYDNPKENKKNIAEFLKKLEEDSPKFCHIGIAKNKIDNILITPTIYYGIPLAIYLGIYS